VKSVHALDLLIWDLVLLEGQIEMGYECDYLFV